MQVEYPDIDMAGILQFVVTHQNVMIQEHFDIEPAFVLLFVYQAWSIGIGVEIAPTTSYIQSHKVESLYEVHLENMVYN
jgi:hypothetical protein